MKFVSLIMTLPLLLIAAPSFAQDDPNCDPGAIVQEYQSKLASAATIEALIDVSNQLDIALMICNYADTEVGTSRVNPVPPNTFAQITNAFSVQVNGYADITGWLTDQGYDTGEGLVYFAVWFVFQCDLPPDQICENYQSIVGFVSESGNVYESESINADDYEYGWELYGGASKDLYSVFSVNEADAENFVIRFQDHDEDYNEYTRFFSPGEMRSVN